ncbi:peptidoglycan-binding protein [Streptomyces boninensis]|uniref:peptidoglycan-binding protein n=1 Tax=Streptomyces boninensis TaxID=2039455 RepID=UPI003B21173A
MSSQQRLDEEAPGAFFDSSDGTGAPEPRRRRHPVRTTLIVATAVALAAAGGVAATGALGGESDDPAATAPSGPEKTAAVERRTLTRSETVDGTLGYGEPDTLQAPSGSRSGTLTRLPGEGDVIKRGERVYSVDQQKVPLLYGDAPLYRPLSSGVEGDDVELLEKNLAALGYTGFTTDDEYTETTAEAVRDWQEDLGREETGKVAPGDAVVASGARRIAEVKALVGAPPNGPVLTWTGTERMIAVDLDTTYEDLVKPGTKASVELPDGSTAKAKVTDVGNAATAKPEEGGSGSDSGSSDEATLPVELSVPDQKKLGRYQAAPVEVTLAAESRKDVLAVPVAALVARKGGGYAVQAVTAGGVEYRPVELGLFANGMVEISGDGITEGLKVGIPR